MTTKIGWAKSLSEFRKGEEPRPAADQEKKTIEIERLDLRPDSQEDLRHQKYPHVLGWRNAGSNIPDYC